MRRRLSGLFWWTILFACAVMNRREARRKRKAAPAWSKDGLDPCPTCGICPKCGSREAMAFSKYHLPGRFPNTHEHI